MAHELVSANGKPGADYFVLLGRLKIQQKSFIEAEENLKQAIVLKHEVGMTNSSVIFPRNTFFLLVNSDEKSTRRVSYTE